MYGCRLLFRAQRAHSGQLETERRAREMIVPTDITEVKLKLRELGEPIQLFGELVSTVVVLLV